MEFKKLLR